MNDICFRDRIKTLYYNNWSACIYVNVCIQCDGEICGVVIVPSKQSRRVDARRAL